ncbi:MAG: hypothetical protein C4297_04655 [Gemmataceae bacterium]
MHGALSSPVGNRQRHGMGTFWQRRWFAVVLCVGIALALADPGGRVSAFLGWFVSRYIVAAVLFSMSWSLPTGRLWLAVRYPAGVLWAYSVSFVLMPLLGAMAAAAVPAADLRIGLLVAVSVPCTLASAAIWTRLAGGDDALALLVTFLTNCTSWLVTTLWLKWATGTETALPVAQMMADLVLYLGVPVLAGQLLRGPALLRICADRGRSALSVLCRLLILIVILQAVVAVRQSMPEGSGPSDIGLTALVALQCLLLHLAGWLVAYRVGAWLRLERERRIGAAFAGSQKSLPVGLMILQAFFADHPRAVLPMLLYHVGQLLVDTVLADVLRHKGSGPAAAAVEPSQ